MSNSYVSNVERAGKQLALYDDALASLRLNPSQSIDRLSFDDYSALLAKNGRISAAPTGRLISDYLSDNNGTFADLMSGKFGDPKGAEIQALLANGKARNDWTKSVSQSNGLYSSGGDITVGTGYDPTLDVWYSGDGLLGDRFNRTYDKGYVTYEEGDATFGNPNFKADWQNKPYESLNDTQKKFADFYNTASNKSVENDYQRTLDRAKQYGVDLGIGGLEDFRSFNDDRRSNVRSILDLAGKRKHAQYTSDFNEERAKASAKRERNKGIALSAAAAFATGGIGGAFGGGLGLSSTAQGALTGAGVGGVNGGVKGALTGGLLGGLGGLGVDNLSSLTEGLSLPDLSGITDIFGDNGGFYNPEALTKGINAALPTADQALAGNFGLNLGNVASTAGGGFFDYGQLNNLTGAVNSLPTADSALNGDFSLNTSFDTAQFGKDGGFYDPSKLNVQDAIPGFDEFFAPKAVDNSDLIKKGLKLLGGQGQQQAQSQGGQVVGGSNNFLQPVQDINYQPLAKNLGFAFNPLLRGKRRFL